MVEASIEQDNPIRHVTDDIFQSINLKFENNLNEYIIILVGDHDHDEIFQYLSKVTSKNRLEKFDDIEKTLQFIPSLHDTNIYLIISGTLGQTHVHRFDTIPQIINVYVYCMDEVIHKNWANEYQKIRCAVSKTKDLLIRLYTDIKHRSGRWSSNEYSFLKGASFSSEWYHLFLLAISHRPQCVGNSYREMFDECQNYYKNNPYWLRKISEFRQTYNANNAIREYTKDNFTYRILNHALRTQNMEIIKKFSPLITDVHSQLREHCSPHGYSKMDSVRTVYRGQYLTVDEFENLRSIWKSNYPVIKLTTFASTSLNPKVAMDFASPAGDRIPCLFEIILTDQYKLEEGNVWGITHTFANISSLSDIPKEEEVLFSLLTHFRVRDVGDRTLPSYRKWVPITLELIITKVNHYTDTQLYFLKRIKEENNSQNYADIVDVLKEIVQDEMKFTSMNWRKWWSTFAHHLGTDAARKQPLTLTLYQCFGEHREYSRRAVEMYKDIIRSVPVVVSIQSSFPEIYKMSKIWKHIPAHWIAYYEQYLEQFCNSNTKEYIECLDYAGQTYEKISHQECALKCYTKVLELDESSMFHNKVKIQERINKLKKPSKCKTQQEKNSNYSKNKNSVVNKPSIKGRLEQLSKYLSDLEYWYDAAESTIILRLPHEDVHNLSVNDYRFNFQSAIKKHMSLNIETTDAANDLSLSCWRYEKYMRDWTSLKELENFFRPCKEKPKLNSNSIISCIERLLKKLNVLVTLCIAYMCIEPGSGKINLHEVLFTDLTKTKTARPVFFDIHDNDLQRDFEALEERIPASGETFTTFQDHERIVPTTIADFIRELQ